MHAGNACAAVGRECEQAARSAQYSKTARLDTHPCVAAQLIWAQALLRKSGEVDTQHALPGGDAAHARQARQVHESATLRRDSRAKHQRSGRENSEAVLPCLQRVQPQQRRHGDAVLRMRVLCAGYGVRHTRANDGAAGRTVESACSSTTPSSDAVHSSSEPQNCGGGSKHSGLASRRTAAPAAPEAVPHLQVADGRFVATQQHTRATLQVQHADLAAPQRVR